MLISIVIPVYNCIGSLENTLNSILVSGLSDYEILLIDDGSTDGTASLCDALQSRHGSVRCIHQDNGGVSYARNRGIQEAQGRYILFFDADDSVDPDSLCGCEEILHEQGPDMLIFGMSFDYYLHGKLYRRDEMVPPFSGLLPKEQWLPCFEALYGCNALSPVWNKFIRRELLTGHEIAFPGGMIEMEDFLFSVRCLKHCNMVWFQQKPVYRYRQPEDESNTFRRLCRIPSLSGYMAAFETELAGFPGGAEIAGQIYASFFYEMLRFGNAYVIARTARDMLQSKYADQIADLDLQLFQLLRKGRYSRIWLRGCAGRLRHWLAVRMKFYRNGGRLQ